MDLRENPRGSLWHRWDPHLHAPGTLLNDQFKWDWAAYLERIKNSSPGVKALGVTDYFSIGTYRSVREYFKKGELGEVELVFPNVEMRLDIFQVRERLAVERHENVAQQDTRLERGAAGIEFDNHDRARGGEFQTLTKLFRQTDRLKPDANKAARDVTPLEQRICDAIAASNASLHCSPSISGTRIRPRAGRRPRVSESGAVS